MLNEKISQRRQKQTVLPDYMQIFGTTRKNLGKIYRWKDKKKRLPIKTTKSQTKNQSKISSPDTQVFLWNKEAIMMRVLIALFGIFIGALGKTLFQIIDFQ